MLLTRASAEQYVKDYFIKCGGDCEIRESAFSEDVVDVRFKHEEGYYTFTVWIEGGKLYGEW